MNVKAILFDLDGTLVDGADAILEAINITLINNHLNPFSKSCISPMIGLPLRQILERIIPKRRAKKILIDKLCADDAKIYEAIYLKKARLIPGVRRSLQNLSKRNIKLAIVTENPRQVAMDTLKQFRLDTVFQVIVSSHDVLRPKPSPDIINKASKELNVVPANLIVVGDSPFDIKAGKAANARTVGVLTGYWDKMALEKVEADIIISSVTELPTILDRMCRKSS